MTSDLPIPLIRRKILRWYARNGRDLPWRKTKNPYRILLSELMLQQTQVARVILYYRRWLQRFPSLTAVAKASNGEVLRLWSGLGYNNRALRFRSLAMIIQKDFSGKFPQDVSILRSLPGIGRYTANALLCFAFGKRVPVVDVNVKRIFSRIFRSLSVNEKTAWEIGESVLPANAFAWNQALMDLGALICTARDPRCGECPIRIECPSAFRPVRSAVNRVNKKEPMRKGIPRRLYRGKILKMLHHQRLHPDEIAAALWKHHTDADVEWINTLVNVMAREGLLEKRKERYGIAE